MPAVPGALEVENVFNHKSMFLIFICTPKMRMIKMVAVLHAPKGWRRYLITKSFFLTTTECYNDYWDFQGNKMKL